MPETVLHLGAHRTATTTLQLAMYRQIELLAAHGIAPIEVNGMRDSFFQPLLKWSAQNLDDDSDEASQVRATIEAIYTQPDVSHVIFSDENMLGAQVKTLRDADYFYDNPHKQIAKLMPFIPEPRVIVLALRNYADFFSSIFAFRYGIVLDQEFDAYRANAFHKTRGWYDVVADLRAALPETPIHVRCFEDYVKDFSILRKAVGLEHVEGFKMGGSNRGLPAEMMPIIKAHIEEHGMMERRQHTRARQAKELDKTTRFEPWSADEKAVLTKRYHSDLARIRDELDIQFETEQI